MAEQNKIPAIAKWLPKPIKNYFFPTSFAENAVVSYGNDWRTIKDVNKNLSGYITPVQLSRIRHDVQLWREAVGEAEQAWYPHRVRMQRMYIDTILNGHTKACVNKRKDLTMMKDFKLCNELGEENEEATKLLKRTWFKNFVNYTLDSIYFGYSLINLGDVINDEFPQLSIIRRWNISPDRMNVTSYVYSLSGAAFLEDPYKDWHIWVPTNTEIGVSKVGYGLLYDVALYEIVCRNLLGFNTDAAELYGMPLRKGRTQKTNEDERAAFAAALSQMGNAGWILLDDLTDEVELVESKGNGQGFKIYENLEARCEKKISKLILGHADALDSTPGKLGAGSGEENPVHEALETIQVKDCAFVENIVNTELLPKLRLHGFMIGEDLHFEFKNDAEKEELRRREDESNQKTANIFKTIKDAGGDPDWAYFSERTGITVEKTASTEPISNFKPSVQNKLNNLYK